MNDGVRVAAARSWRASTRTAALDGLPRRGRAAFARHPDAAGVGGAFLPAGETLVERVSRLARASRLGVGGGYGVDRAVDDHPVRSVQCGAYRRAGAARRRPLRRRHGVRRGRGAQLAALRAACALMLCPDAGAALPPARVARALWTQYWNYGRGRMRVLRKHPAFLAPAASRAQRARAGAARPPGAGAVLPGGALGARARGQRVGRRAGRVGLRRAQRLLAGAAAAAIRRGGHAPGVRRRAVAGGRAPSEPAATHPGRAAHSLSS